ncbi:hypothetical protein ACFLZX_00120 [Nanoarchaeota archaeon]
MTYQAPRAVIHEGSNGFYGRAKLTGSNIPTFNMLVPFDPLDAKVQIFDHNGGFGISKDRIRLAGGPFPVTTSELLDTEVYTTDQYQKLRERHGNVILASDPEFQETLEELIRRQRSDGDFNGLLAESNSFLRLAIEKSNGKSVACSLTTYLVPVEIDKADVQRSNDSSRRYDFWG